MRGFHFKKAHFFLSPQVGLGAGRGDQAKIIEKSIKREEKTNKMIQKRFKTYSNINSGRYKEPAAHTTPPELGDTTISIFWIRKPSELEISAVFPSLVT